MMYRLNKKFISCFVVTLVLVSVPRPSFAADGSKFWRMQSIDTMKYSRDVAREKLTDRSYDTVIDRQVRDIAATGATHVAIATPYDSEFLPFLKRWVAAARKYKLNVWFRGNWSGWEEWFDYQSISRNEHIQKTKAFILANPGLFKDGDIFSGCPECENGGPGDPRWNNDLKGHRKFIIDEYAATKQAFAVINKDVASNYFSMNGDVARLVMDKSTTEKLDGIVVIDHYVKTVDRLVNDIKYLAEQSGGRIVLGEWGAPIPDIHGALTPKQQAAWVENALANISLVPELVGLNYWVNIGGSTALWSSKGVAYPAVTVLKKYYNPTFLRGVVKDPNRPVAGATVKNDHQQAITDADGRFVLAFPRGEAGDITISADGFQERTVAVAEDAITAELTVSLQRIRDNIVIRIIDWLRALIW